jgi:site-specific DNA recombinase
MFERRLGGRSVAGIARELNERGVPCPSHVDPDRNRHRAGDAWTLRSVTVILRNPRYTVRQVWNRQRTERVGGRVVHRSNSSDAWVVSKKVAHPALVSEREFVAVQAVRSVRPTGDGSIRVYVLAGLVRCRLCRRRMDSHWVNGRAGYRCRHGHTSARRQSPDRPRNLYVREDVLLAGLATWFTGRSTESRGNVGTAGEWKVSGGEVAAALRSEGLMVVCAGVGWALDVVA